MGAELGTYRNYVGGQWIDAGGHFDDFNPYNGELVARAPAGTRADAAAAVAAAHEAFAGWSVTPPETRQRIFLKAADLMEARREDLLGTLAAETGASAGFGGFQLKRAVSELRQAAGWVYQPKGELIPSDSPGATHMAVRRPLGVVAGFSPWNGALVLAWRTVVSPIAFGNTVVLKPSELAPLSAGLLVAEVMEEAGLPAGVLNVVAHAPGGAAAIADEFFENDAVRCLNFTGSSRTGRMLAERAGATLKRIVLELGGYNPLIVLADVDLDYATEATAFGAFFHQGEICMNARKAIVEASVYDDFLARLRARTERLPVGDPADPATVVGPHGTPEEPKGLIGEVELNTVPGAFETKALIDKAVSHKEYEISGYAKDYLRDKAASFGDPRSMNMVYKFALYFAVDLGLGEIDEDRVMLATRASSGVGCSRNSRNRSVASSRSPRAAGYACVNRPITRPTTTGSTPDSKNATQAATPSSR